MADQPEPSLDYPFDSAGDPVYEQIEPFLCDLRAAARPHYARWSATRPLAHADLLALMYILATDLPFALLFTED